MNRTSLWHLVDNVGNLIIMASQGNVGKNIRVIPINSLKIMVRQITFNHLIQLTAVSMINTTCQNTLSKNEIHIKVEINFSNEQVSHKLNTN